jgi:hypothetical protein
MDEKSLQELCRKIQEYPAMCVRFWVEQAKKEGGLKA